MNETFEQCRKNLLRRGFEVRIAATTEEARQILREEIRAAAPETISFGGSMTMEATGIVDELRRDRKSTRLNSSHMPKSRMPSSA